MASTVTVTQIANLALSKLGPGSGYIADIATDTTAAGQALARTYEMIRDEVQEAHPWNFCVKRALLPSDIPTPLWGYDFQFTLPADCLRFLSIEQAKVKFQVEGDKLLADEKGPLKIRYISRVTDTSKFTGTFVAALAARWSFEICNVIEARATPDQVWSIYQQMLRQAKRMDAQANSGEEMPDGDWLTARL
jgi:hypothetical protein